MSDSDRAVFLSYASQDAEAAKRICEVLRGAGVEVWFDQNELVGGDAWDAKIRGQISSCALFMPVISASTQARLEGYFRIEWKIAARRTHAMATAKAFLLPIVIDDTHDASAHVPDEFRDVQWTRLPAGETSPAFAARVKKLLDGGPEVRGQRSDDGGQRTQNLKPRTENRRPGRLWWALPIFGVTMALVLILKEGRRVTPDQEVSRRAAPELSPARQFVAKAWQALDSLPEPSRAELDTAAEYYQRAAALDPTDADVWALGSQIDTWYVAENIDDSPGRRESARTKATKALNLAPASYEARLAQAVYLVRGEGFDTPSSFAAEAELQLRALLREQPDEPHALLALGHLLRNSRKIEEASPLFDRLALNPAWTATATNAKAWMLYRNARFDEAVAVVARSVAARPFHGNVRLQGYLAMQWQGDLELAKTAVERMPAAELREDDGAYFAVTMYWFRREPEQMLRVLNTRPTDWVQSHSFTGPKGYWLGMAQQMAGNQPAATLAWQGGLRLVEQQLAGHASSAELQALKGQLLVRLGERAAAEKAFNLAGHLGWQGWTAFELGDAEAVLAQPDRGAWINWAILRLSPAMDFLRGDPRFEAFVAAAANDPKRSPRVKQVVSSATSAVVKTDQKSVAVLAFANLSDDKANEYFSDGISEELLNVLAKVPGLKVTARTSSFHFKGTNTAIPEIASQLGVAYVVEGSVRKAGDKVRITAQLIKAADGFHVWSDNFTRDLKDVFAVQDEIAGLIAKNLELKIGTSSAASTVAVNPEAFELYVQARRAWNLRNAAGFQQAEELLTRALTLEPDFARAHAALADVWTLRALANGVIETYGQRSAPVFTQVVGEIEKALALDPDSSEARASYGLIVRFRQWDLAASERELRRSIELNPNYATAHHWLGNCLSESGRIDEGLGELRRAAELDPFSLRILENYGKGLVRAGRHEEALAVLGRAETLSARAPLTLYTKAAALLQLGRRAEAIAVARELGDTERAEVLARAGEKAEAEAALGEAEGWWRYELLVALGRTAEAIAALRAEEVPASEVGNWLMDPRLDPFRHDPHFVELLTTLGLTDAHARAQAWRAAHPPTKP